MKLTVKALLAIGVMALSGTASAVQVYLVQNGNRAGSGTLYNAVTNSGGATWDWDAGTGVLTGTGLLQSDFYIGSTLAGSYYFSDKVTDLVIDTVNGTTTASSYECIEGVFGAGTGSNVCGNINLGLNGTLQSTIQYNAGGSATCSVRTILGDDSSGTPAVFRGLESADPGPCDGPLAVNQSTDNSGRGAFDMTQVVQAFGGDQYLILANWNGDGAVMAGCIATKGVGYPNQAGNAACNRAHWLTFQMDPVPVPAAVWLFGSALGLLGVARRRAA